MPRARKQLGDDGETLRMPRHEHEQRIAGKGAAGQRVEQQRFLAVAGARRQPDRTRRPEAQPESGAELERGGRDADVELEVAGDDRLAVHPGQQSRAASASDCAATPARRCNIGRVSARARR